MLPALKKRSHLLVGVRYDVPPFGMSIRRPRASIRRAS